MSKDLKTNTVTKQKLKIFFDNPKTFEMQNIKPLMGLTGLYFIFSEKSKIQYPFRSSRLLYIGMSEKRTNSIGKRLIGHFEGESRNWGLINYKKVDRLYFTYINFEMLRKVWQNKIEDLESYFILDFVKKYGVYPICNNKSGYDILEKELTADFAVDWSYFE